MNEFEKKQPARRHSASDNSASRRGVEATWRRIREDSVQQFVDRVAKAFGYQADRELRAGLQHMALSGGGTFAWRGTPITDAMALDAWRTSFRRDLDDGTHAPFTPEQARQFREAMAKVRDQSVPMIGRRHLLAIGEDIEARQLAMAER